MIPSVMGGSRSRQPRQLRRPFSSKGTFQGGMMTMIMIMTMVRMRMMTMMMMMIMIMTMVRMRMISSLCFQLYIWQDPSGCVSVLLVQNSWHLFHYWPFDRPPQTPPSPCQSGHVTSPNQIFKIFTLNNIHPKDIHPSPWCQSGHVTSPSRKFPSKAKSGNEIVKSDISPPPKSPKMCGLFLPKQQKDTSSSGISVSQHLPPVSPNIHFPTANLFRFLI